MNVALILKVLPFLWGLLKAFIPKHCVIVIIAFLIIFGVSSYFMVDYVDAKHTEVTKIMSTQKTIMQSESATQYKLTSQSLENISKGIDDMKGMISKLNDKVWELSRDNNRR